MALTFYFDSCATKFEFDDFCMHFVTHVMLEWMTRFHTKGEIALVGCSSEVGTREEQGLQYLARSRHLGWRERAAPNQQF